MPDGLRKRKYFVNTFKGNWKKTHKYTHTNTSFNLLCYLLIQAYIDDKNQVSIQLFPNSFTKVLVTLSFFKKIVGNRAKKANLKTGVKRKQSMSNFPKNNYFLPPDTHTYVCVSESEKCSFFRKCGVLCFLATPILRFVLLLSCRQITTYISPFHIPDIFSLKL